MSTAAHRTDPLAPTRAPRDASIDRAGAAAWYALGALVVVTLFAFVDRQVFVLQAQPIKVELGLSDLQLGLLQGVGIALFAAIAGYPLGWLADRFDRRVVLSGCIVVWSAAVAACSMARDFPSLLLASAVVGAGEAGMTPVVFALIPELFRHRQRVVANSIYAIATRLGFGLAIAVCGQLVTWVDWARPMLPASLDDLATWRLTFIAAALPAPLMLLLVASVRAGRRPATPVSPDRGASSGAVRVGPFVAAHRRTFFGFFVGIGFAVFGFASIISWAPTIAMRMYGETATQAGNATGLATFIATAIGFAFSVFGLRWLEPRFGVRLPMVVLWVSSIAAAATTLLLLATTSAMQIYVLQGVQYAFAIAGIMLYPTALQSLCPAALRARIVAINGVVSVVCGALSPVAVGALSDALAPRSDGLLVAAVTVASVALVAAGALLRWATDPYPGTVAAAEAESDPT